uniref:Synaptotagmin-like protein 1 n=1 Tax=Tetraodon nigroviridis TaxID=99883 RepID=H3DHW8_TETNG
LDLSHLTEAEQSKILQVLQRDLDLRLLDEGRVRILQETETDQRRLRSLSGAWFTEERNKRHHTWSGSALVHATLRCKRTKNRVTEAPLEKLFDGEQEKASPSGSASPEVEGRLKDEGSHLCLKASPTPRTKSPSAKVCTCSCTRAQKIQNINSTGLYFQGLQHKNSSTSSSKGMKVPPPSVSSSPLFCLPFLPDRSDGRKPDPSGLRTSSIGSLHSSTSLSGSMMSLFSSGDFGAVEVRGRIQFSLVYDARREELMVKVHCCEGIASARRSHSYPYVKTYLLPDKTRQSKRKTAVKKKTVNPVYDETFRYQVQMGDLQSRTLNLSVWHAEAVWRNVFLGEVEVSLGLWDWTYTQPVWQDLQPRVNMNPESISSRGTIVLSIKFIPDGFEVGGGLPVTGELHIWLREARGLLSYKGGPVNSFVKSYILPDASRESGQKTRMVKHSISPTFNHTMVYDGFYTSDLREACAELTVWQKDGIKTRVLGGVRLSCGSGQSYGEHVSWMDSTEEEVAVWTSMIKNPNCWIDTTLPVRTNLARR